MAYSRKGEIINILKICYETSRSRREDNIKMYFRDVKYAE
jgi:hypothetical protein